MPIVVSETPNSEICLQCANDYKIDAGIGTWENIDTPQGFRHVTLSFPDGTSAAIVQRARDFFQKNGNQWSTHTHKLWVSVKNAMDAWTLFKARLAQIPGPPTDGAKDVWAPHRARIQGQIDAAWREIVEKGGP